MFRPNTKTLAKDDDSGPSKYDWLEIHFVWRSLNITLLLYGFQSFHTVEGYWPQVDDIDMICEFKIVMSGQFCNVWYTYPNIRQYAMLFHIVKFSQLHVSNCRPLTMFERASDRELAGLYHNYIWRSPECIIPFLSLNISLQYSCSLNTGTEQCEYSLSQRVLLLYTPVPKNQVPNIKSRS